MPDHWFWLPFGLGFAAGAGLTATIATGWLIQLRPKIMALANIGERRGAER